jgi:hypothetical protein
LRCLGPAAPGFGLWRRVGFDCGHRSDNDALTTLLTLKRRLAIRDTAFGNPVGGLAMCAYDFHFSIPLSSRSGYGYLCISSKSLAKMIMLVNCDYFKDVRIVWGSAGIPGVTKNVHNSAHPCFINCTIFSRNRGFIPVAPGRCFSTFGQSDRPVGWFPASGTGRPVSISNHKRWARRPNAPRIRPGV